jgi:hypothetical protein
MMEAASTSKTSINFYQTARRKNPEVILLNTFWHHNPEKKIGPQGFSWMIIISFV